MKQLSGVDLDNLLQNISRLPGALADSVEGAKSKRTGEDSGEVFGSD